MGGTLHATELIRHTCPSSSDSEIRAHAFSHPLTTARPIVEGRLAKQSGCNLKLDVLDGGTGMRMNPFEKCYACVS